LESVWIEQKRTLENLESAHQSTLIEVRRCHQVEVESLKRELQGRIEDLNKRQREFEGRANETIRSLKSALFQAQQETRKNEQHGSRREAELESRITELLARMDAEAKVNFERVSEIEKRHQLEKEQLQFDYQKSRSFLLAANQRLEEIARDQESELEEAKKRILILGGDPHRNPEQEMRVEIEALRSELARLGSENSRHQADLQSRSFEVSILKDELAQVRSECADVREQLEMASGSATFATQEAAVLRANLARVEGLNGFLEMENRLHKERSSQLERELKAASALQSGSEDSVTVEVDCPPLDEIREKVEREREKALHLLKEGASRIIGS
jgi:chromosome segregation ATPase